MTPIDIDIIRRKLSTIIENLDLLRPIGSLSFSDYQEDTYRRKATERLLQIIVEAAVDVCAHALVGTGYPAPADNYQAFLDLAEKGRVIDLTLAQALAPSAGLRNRLVHEYERIDDRVVFQAVSRTLDIFPRFVQAVANHLQKVDQRG